MKKATQLKRSRQMKQSTQMNGSTQVGRSTTYRDLDAHGQRLSGLPGISTTAFLIADPTRALMLDALLDGRALPAGELARLAGVTPQTASSHLARLIDGGLMTVEYEGRHRHHRLAGSHVAQALERLAEIRPARETRNDKTGHGEKHRVDWPIDDVRNDDSRDDDTRNDDTRNDDSRNGLARVTLGPRDVKLRHCRRCYDHLAGRVGVAIARALQRQGCLRPVDDKRFVITDAGIAWFADIGVDVKALKPGQRGVARQCLDWTERFHHLGGPLGVQMMASMFERGWLRSASTPRVLTVTPPGWQALRARLGLNEASITRP